MVHPINELRKVREDGLAKARDPELAFVTRAELNEALAPILAALEVEDVAATVVYAIEDDAVSGNPTKEEGPASAAESLESAESEKGRLDETSKEPHPAESDPEGLALVEKIHERKSRAKRKPEGQDPLGLVPDPQGDDS
jgi:hypothetical protein